MTLLISEIMCDNKNNKCVQVKTQKLTLPSLNYKNIIITKIFISFQNEWDTFREKFNFRFSVKNYI